VPSFSAWAACGYEHGDVPAGLHYRLNVDNGLLAVEGNNDYH
jgi:hypothetical protein